VGACTSPHPPHLSLHPAQPRPPPLGRAAFAHNACALMFTVHSCYHEQNSVYKAADACPRQTGRTGGCMVEHGMTRDRPHREHVFSAILSAGNGVPCGECVCPCSVGAGVCAECGFTTAFRSRRHGTLSLPLPRQGVRDRPPPDRAAPTSLETKGALRAVCTVPREVEFSDRCQTPCSEGVQPGRLRRSRTRVWVAKMIRYRCSPAP